MMVRFGVDFPTMTPLEAEQTKGLRLASSSYWDLMIASAPDDGEDSSSDESELSVGWDAGDQMDPLPTQGTPEYTETVTRHIENLLQCYVSVQTTTQALQVTAAEATLTRRPSGSSGMVRRRKQTTPRRARASQVSAEAPAADDQRPRDEEARQEAPPDPRERLLALPGIIATRLPNRESLDRLQKYLQENQPCDPQQVEQPARSSDTGFTAG
ncbi:unnamed protein product [Pocillopora meandrina]|uniref:Uncharacterized protein n=1 Tax=Pocillopora meandrina TaxID=46732 RepID=A0AAU9W1M3_9CNID|nr:unnamed protein product [Pocillopora meandrina]